MIPRDKVVPLEETVNIPKDVHDQLIADGASNHRLWSDEKYKNHAHVNAFRAEVKAHYYWHQRNRCCYCSYLLHPNGRVYDAEHIIDKSGFPEFMFLPKNLAVACTLCNSHKSAKSVFIEGLPRPATIPNKTDAYRILHPHLDDWEAHLRFDELGRVYPVEGSAKGAATMEICGIEALNFLALSGEFAPASRKLAYDLMCKVVTYVSQRKIEATLSAMEQLAEKTPGALAVVVTLRDRFMHQAA